MELRLRRWTRGADIPESLLDLESSCFDEPPIVFPREELRRLTDEGLVHAYSAETSEGTVGFGFIIPSGGSAYVFLLGVDPERRGCGYGRGILGLLRDQYPDRSFILDCEEPVIDFYIQSGMRYTGYNNLFLGIRFFVMAFGEFDEKDYTDIMQVIMHHDDTIPMTRPDGTGYDIVWNPVND